MDDTLRVIEFGRCRVERRVKGRLAGDSSEVLVLREPGRCQMGMFCGESPNGGCPFGFPLTPPKSGTLKMDILNSQKHICSVTYRMGLPRLALDVYGQMLVLVSLSVSGQNNPQNKVINQSWLDGNQPLTDFRQNFPTFPGIADLRLFTMLGPQFDWCRLGFPLMPSPTGIPPLLRKRGAALRLLRCGYRIG